MSLLNSNTVGEWSNYEFSFASGVQLSAGSQYWILYRNLVQPEVLANSHALWLDANHIVRDAAETYDAFQTELGWVVDGAITSTGDAPPAAADRYKPGVWSINAAVVPEPSSALLISFVGTLALIRRTRNHS